MTFTPQDRELVRLSSLRLLDTVAGRALGESLITQRLSSEFGQRIDPDQARAELDYLRDKGLIDQAHKDISPEIHAWRITAQGRDSAAQSLGL